MLVTSAEANATVRPIHTGGIMRIPFHMTSDTSPAWAVNGDTATAIGPFFSVRDQMLAPSQCAATPFVMILAL